MLATILKGDLAVQTTLAIIDTFYKIRHLSRNLKELATVQDKNKQKSLMQKSGEIIAEILDDDLETTDTETTVELNFAVLKFKHQTSCYVKLNITGSLNIRARVEGRDQDTPRPWCGFHQ